MRDVQMTELRRWTEHCDQQHEPTSQWTIGEQIEHCCLVARGVTRLLRESTPPVPRRGFNLRRWAVWMTGRIPAGRAKASRGVSPQERSDRAALARQLQAAQDDVASLASLPADAWFKHFVFGVLSRDDTLRFLDIHTQHHLRIIRRIAARASGEVTTNRVE